MKKGLLLSFIMITTLCNAQNSYVIENSYQPLTIDEIVMGVNTRVNRFNQYKDKAYECLNKRDFEGFIYYSDFALKTGYYNAKLYYYRGYAYEKLHNYSKAKKEYNKAIKKGYYEAVSALEQCKINQKNWQNNHK